MICLVVKSGLWRLRYHPRSQGSSAHLPPERGDCTPPWCAVTGLDLSGATKCAGSQPHRGAASHPRRASCVLESHPYSSASKPLSQTVALST